MRTCLYVPAEGHAYPRPADLTPVALAKWSYGASDRHGAPRVTGPNADIRRAAPAASSCFVCGVLQSGAHALGITERCALASSSPAVWCHCHHSDLGRAASSIRSDMIFGKDRLRTTKGTPSSCTTKRNCNAPRSKRRKTSCRRDRQRGPCHADCDWGD